MTTNSSRKITLLVTSAIITGTLSLATVNATNNASTISSNTSKASSSINASSSPKNTSSTATSQSGTSVTKTKIAANLYSVNGRAEIKSNALMDLNHHNISKYVGMGGTITKITQQNKSLSHYVYQIRLDNGTLLDGILEQDLSSYVAANFANNTTVQISSNAYLDLNRHNISKYSNQIATIIGSRHFNYASSHFVYQVKLSDGTILSDILEQDLHIFKYSNKYANNQTVNLTGNAWSTSDNKRIDKYRGYVGIITKVTYKKVSHSNYVYDIKLDDGTLIRNVLEQDLDTYSANRNMYANGAMVKISNNAWATATGDKTLNKQHGWYGKITKITRFSGSYSHYMYTVTFTNNSHTENILEQDIKAFGYVSDQVVNKDMVINSSNRSDGMYLNYPAPVPTSQWADSTKNYNKKIVHATRLVKTNSGTSWYLVSVNNKSYYIDSKGLKDYVAPKAKFTVNDQVAISNNAWANKSGQRITQYQNQNVTILSVSSGHYSNSDYTYNVKLSNGVIITDILEQDLIKANQSAFNVNTSAYITKNAWATANGVKINMKAGKHVTIIAKYARQASNSKWQYDVKLDNGIIYKNVLEQDLQIDKVIFKVDSNKVVAWFENHKGKLTYSMYGSRNGADGTADCSGSITQALYEAGASPYDYLYSTETLHDYLINNAYKLIVNNDYRGWNAQKGDIVIWGKRGQSGGAGGHVGVMTNNADNPFFISTCYITGGQKNTAVQEVRYNEYVAQHNYPYYYVYRLIK